jgi:hypothetical protein
LKKTVWERDLSVIGKYLSVLSGKEFLEIAVSDKVVQVI